MANPTIPVSQNSILIVDDNANVRRAISRSLQIENYATRQAANGKEALEMLTQYTPDLILSDINMPIMDGIEFFKAVRDNKEWSPIPFVLLTSAASPADVQKGRELGVEDYLTKPIDTNDLVAIINARLLRSSEVKVSHINQSYLETVTALANAIESRDNYTGGHVDRVTTYTIWLTQELLWPAEHIRFLEFGARLHDIGKVIVPDRILNKPGKLSPREWNLMRKHPAAGAKMLQGVSHLKDILPYIYHHHERWDGTGYPKGLKGKEISIGGRILAIADVYDALTTTRPYRPARPRKVVIQFLRLQAGKHFDPDLIPTFIKAIKKRTPLN
ncbi:MAG: putative cyclic di-GMP phosphodiesterase [Chloroflexi bacterium]|nr:putative cyclic di-GMP phosphodiesterase [Chloroflexota bacterium]